MTTQIHQKSATLFANSFSNTKSIYDKATDFYMGTNNLNQSIVKPLPQDQVSLAYPNSVTFLYVTMIYIENSSEAHINSAGVNFNMEVTSDANLMKCVVFGFIGLFLIIFS